ncbi:MAG: redox-regulated ATPase YchF [Patescibacteria group bacterium]
MSLSVAIVGLPNVGKSTLFNALLKRQQALAANYPFATIDPNTGIVPVPDERLDVLAKIVHTSVLKPATVEFVDIAGLVKGASEGAGLGNQFLSHIRETDLICHVVRGFTDSDVIREGSVDPKTDRETIETELLLADLATLEKQKPPKSSITSAEKERWSIVSELKEAADAGLRTAVFEVAQKSEDHARVAKELSLLSTKVMLYVVNVDEGVVGDKSQAAAQAKELGISEEAIVIVSAKIESELSSLDDTDQKAYLKDLGLEQSGLERLIKKAYQLLGLQSFLTAGELEVRAWTIHQGMRAPQAAAVIHTDFEKHFIKANISSYEDFVQYQGWKGVKDVGKMRMEGKEYVMNEGDVVEFMIGK